MPPTRCAGPRRRRAGRRPRRPRARPRASRRGRTRRPRARVASPRTLAAAVEEAGLALLGLRRGATWAQLTALLRSLLAEGDIGPAEPESLGGLPSGDLFAVANAVGALLDAPVTIEDRSSRVLAFSGRQDEADPSRVETIIGRQVPERYARMLTELGVFRELYRENRPVVVNPADARRRHHQQAASRDRCPRGRRGARLDLGRDGRARSRPSGRAALQDAAKLVALHMLRVRAGADVQRRLRTDLVSTALEGGAGRRRRAGPAGAGRQAGRRPGRLPARRARRPTRTRPRTARGGLDRVADALAVHLSASMPSSAVAVVGGIAFALLPVHGAGLRPRAAGRPVGRGLLRAAGHAAADRGGHRRGRVRRRRRDRVPGDGDAGPASPPRRPRPASRRTAARRPHPVAPARAPRPGRRSRRAAGGADRPPAWSTTRSNDSDLTETLAGVARRARRRPRRRRRALHPPQHAALPAAPARGDQRDRPRRPRPAVRGHAPAPDADAASLTSVRSA